MAVGIRLMEYQKYLKYQKYQKYKQRYLNAKKQYDLDETSGGGSHYDEEEELDIIIKVASMGGETREVSAPADITIADLKKKIANELSKKLSYAGTIQLYRTGQEDPLQDTDTLSSLSITDGSTLFMLPIPNAWFWNSRSRFINLSSPDTFYGQIAQIKKSSKSPWGKRQLVTGGEIMETGRHYWEIKINREDRHHANLFIGACSPPGETNGSQMIRKDYANIDWSDNYPGYFISSSGLYGHGVGFLNDPNRSCHFRQGDTIGILLDLDERTIKFYRNKERLGPDWPVEVKAPLLKAAVITTANTEIEIVSNSQIPEDT